MLIEGNAFALPAQELRKCGLALLEAAAAEPELVPNPKRLIW
jgi:hypothetical protein